VIRELGARTPGTYLTLHEAGEHEHVVLETYANLDPKAVRVIDTTARRIESIVHPHVVAVVGVERISSGVAVLSEWLEGLPVEEVFFKLSLGARLRIVVDILGALSALHGALGGPPIVHAGVLGRSAFVTRNGFTKLGFAYRAPLCLGKDAVAPEALLSDEAELDPRTDVYSAGVMLWEAIMGRPLFHDDRPEQIIAAQLANRVPKLEVPSDVAWAAALIPVVERALAIAPKDRFPHVASMAGELRLAVRARLSVHEVVAKQLWPHPSSGIQKVHEITGPVTATAQSETRVLAAKPFVASEPPPPAEPAPEPELVVTPSQTTRSETPGPMLPEVRRKKSRAWIGAAVAAIGLAASLALVFGRSSAPHPIAHDAAPPPPVAAGASAPPVHAEPESAAPSAPPPAAAPKRPAASATAPASPAPKKRRGTVYNPSSI